MKILLPVTLLTLFYARFITSSSVGEFTAQQQRIRLEQAVIDSHVGGGHYDEKSTQLSSMIPPELHSLAEISPDSEQARQFIQELEAVQLKSALVDQQDLRHLDAAKDLYEIFENHPDLPPSPEVKPVFLDELKFFASISAAAYCMRRSIIPAWQCGYPRCSTRDLQFPADSQRPTDVLSGMQTLDYMTSPVAHMVAFTAFNPVLDSLSLSPIPDHSKSSLIISFRGSLHYMNFYYDLRAGQVEFYYPLAPNSSFVYKGFHETWLDIEPQMLAAVRSAVKKMNSASDSRPRHLEIVITGHSLGGATGVFCALALRKLALEDNAEALGLEICHSCSEEDRLADAKKGWFRFHNVVLSFKTFTYGEPRLGNKVFADWVMNLPGFPIHRTTFFDDLVPHLPPRKLDLGSPWMFRHHAAEYHIKQLMKSTVSCDDSLDDPEQASSNNLQHRFISPVDKGPLKSDRGEAPGCSAGVRFLNVFSHLTYWNVLYGPWC